MAKTIVDLGETVTGGVDTHLDLNVVAAVDGLGGLLGVTEFPADQAGHARALAWLGSHGRLVKVGVEGTSSYGVGLARHLRGAGIEVVEVDRPNCQSRRRTGKSDPVDAIEAARAALSGRARSGHESPWVPWRPHTLEARMESWQPIGHQNTRNAWLTAQPRGAADHPGPPVTKELGTDQARWAGTTRQLGYGGSPYGPGPLRLDIDEGVSRRDHYGRRGAYKGA